MLWERKKNEVEQYCKLEKAKKTFGYTKCVSWANIFGMQDIIKSFYQGLQRHMSWLEDEFTLTTFIHILFTVLPKYKQHCNIVAGIGWHTFIVQPIIMTTVNMYIYCYMYGYRI